MRVLITGGAGFIGSHVAERALQQGYDVAVLDDLSTGRRENVPPGVKLWEVDLRDGAAVRSVIEEFRPEAISHQAAQASVAVSLREPQRDAEVNIIGTLNLLEAAVACGARSVVFASTGGAIYGEVPEGRSASEETAPNPRSPYAASKFAVEAYLGFYRAEYGLATTVLRYANVFGPRQDPHGEAGVVAIFANRILRGEEIRINARRDAGDAGCVRDYVYVSDVADANLAALSGALTVPVLNVGTGVGTTTLQLATAMQQAAGLTVPVSFHPRRPGDVERSVLDASQFSQLLHAPVPLENGLAETIEWFRAKHNGRSAE